MFPATSIASFATLILVTLVALGGPGTAPRTLDRVESPSVVETVEFATVEADIESFALDLVRERNAE